MPGNLFNLGRYFKKEDKPASDEAGKTSITYQEKTVTQSSAGPYSGIGKTPGGGEPYSGIGNPPVQQTTTQKTTVTSPPVSSTATTVTQTTTPPQPGAQPAQTEATVTPSPVPTQSGSIDMTKRIGMDVLTRLTQRSNQALMIGVTKAKDLRVKYIDTEHILWGLLSDAQIYQLISDLKVTPKEIQDYLEKNFKKGVFPSQPQFSPRVKKVLELSLSTARAMKLEFVSPEHILLALVQEGEGMAAQTMVKFGLTVEVLNKKITGKKEGIAEEEKRKTSTIEEYCEDLTQKAREGKLDPVVGRAAEIERTIHILSRRTKNNPVLIGDAGVGKTAIVEGLAQRIAKGDVAETLRNKRILQLDLMSLIAGASHRGDFEERLKNLIKEVKQSAGTCILFIDEIHNMVGAGAGTEGTMDASNILKPSLARGELQTIGTTTITEYRKYIEKDPALERRFQPIMVLEPTEDQAIEMLYALRDKYEAFHKVSIPDETIDVAVRLSKRYVGDRFLPDKAVDLIDEAGAAVRLPAISLPEEIKALQGKLTRFANERKEAEKLNDQLKITSIDKDTEDAKAELNEKTQAFEKKKSTTTNVVTPEVIQEIVSRWTNIPVSRLTEKETDKLVKMEDLIHKRIINQEQAVSAVSEAVRRGRAGLKSEKRPTGSFIFMGPTGVGKTELAKALAEILFGNEDLIVRLDMSEYMERHEVAKLIGAPPGYIGYEEGGQLTEAVRRHPYSVVLFDEIEKAHPDVFNILIQLLDDGRLTDNKGRTVSFKNTIVICTSNIGTGLIQRSMLTNDDNSSSTTTPVKLTYQEVAQRLNLPEEKVQTTLNLLFQTALTLKPQTMKNLSSNELIKKIAEITVINEEDVGKIFEAFSKAETEIDINKLTQEVNITTEKIFAVTHAVGEDLLEEAPDRFNDILKDVYQDNVYQELEKQTGIPLAEIKKVTDFISNQLPINQPTAQTKDLEAKTPGQNQDKFSQLTNMLLDELRKFFRPELLNRFDEVIVFQPLAFAHMMQIVQLQIKQLNALLADQNLGLQVTPEAAEKLAVLGFDPIYGARPLRRTIQRMIENPISTLLIKGEAVAADTIVVDLEADEFNFTVKKATQTATNKTQSEIKDTSQEPVSSTINKEETPPPPETTPQVPTSTLPNNNPSEKINVTNGQTPATTNGATTPLSSYYTSSDEQPVSIANPTTPSK